MGMAVAEGKDDEGFPFVCSLKMSGRALQQSLADIPGICIPPWGAKKEASMEPS